MEVCQNCTHLLYYLKIVKNCWLLMTRNHLLLRTSLSRVPFSIYLQFREIYLFCFEFVDYSFNREYLLPQLLLSGGYNLTPSVAIRYFFPSCALYLRVPAWLSLLGQALLAVGREQFQLVTICNRLISLLL